MACWRWAEERGLVQCLPPRVRPLKAGDPRKRPYSDSEVRRVLDWAREHRPAYHPLLELLADTGRRVSAICALRGSDVRREALEVHVLDKGRRQAVPVSPGREPASKGQRASVTEACATVGAMIQRSDHPPRRNVLLEAQDDVMPTRPRKARGVRVLGPCSFPGCASPATYGKAGCEEHIDLQPYAARLMREMEEEARSNASGRPTARQVEEARAILEEHEGEVWLRLAALRLGAPIEVAARALREAGARRRVTRRGATKFRLSARARGNP